MATLKYLLDVSAPNAQKTFDGIGVRLADLDKSLNRKRELNIGDASAKATLTRLQLQSDKLRESLKHQDLTIEGAAKAESQLLGLESTADRLNKKLSSEGSIFGKLGKSGAVQPSVGGTLLGLSPALLPLAGVLSADIGAIGISFGAAGIGAGAFALLAKSAFTTASTAAGAVEQAQNVYNASIATGTKKATAYRTEQKAIKLAYAELTPAQIRLSQTIGDMQNAWQGVQQATTPLITGALEPWIKAVTKAIQYIKPFITPIAAVFKDWGQSLDKYFSSSTGSTEISKIATAFGKFSATQLRDIGTFIGDIATAFFNLGKDLGSGGNFNQAGMWLSNWGAAFLGWSKSAQARKDVQGFMHYIQMEGPVISGILKDIVKFLPGIFAGATAAGTLELKALSDFLGFVAKLPAGIAKPLVELAGAMLLLSKTGVLKVGLQFVGALAGGGAGAAEGAAAAGGAAGLWSKMLPGVRLVGGVLAATLVVDMVLKNTSSGQGKNWFDNPFGMPGPQSKASANNWLTSWAPYERFLTVTIPGWFEAPVTATQTMWKAITKDNADGVHGFASAFDDMRHTIADWLHDIANTFDQFRRFQGQTGAFEKDIAFTWDKIHGNTVQTWDFIRHYLAGVLDDMQHAIAVDFDDMRHTIASVLDGTRHDIAAAWDSIWKSSGNQAHSGVNGIVNWVKTLPSRIVNALEGLGTTLYNFGHMIWDKFLHGMLSMQINILGWVGHFVGAIWDKVKKFFGLGSPSKLFYDAGKNLMIGLENGIKDHAHRAVKAAGGVAHQVSSAGSGVQQWAPLVRKALAMEGLFPGLAGNVLYQMQTESGGNPNAINLTDSNAAAGDPSRGLMQTIMTTFDAYHWPGTSWNIYDPLANIAAALNYARHQYGPDLMKGGMGIGSGHGYDTGGWLPVGTSIAHNFTGRPERVLGPNEGVKVVVEFRTGAGATELERGVIAAVQKYVIVHGGDAQAALGQRA